ncbi:MAG: Fic family protein, partial [Cellvibrionaceae bacterium]|nr:Fic family protein [Cellvibrionaceae bacterium]
QAINPDEVRDSIKGAMGLLKFEPKHNKSAYAAAQISLHCRSTFDQPLSHTHLHHWHELMAGSFSDLAVTPGMYRHDKSPMEVISHKGMREIVHYVAPPAEQVYAQMSTLINWHRQAQAMSAPIKAAYTHAWFELIHPFGDGNGRIGRTIAEKTLYQGLGKPGYLSLSTAILNDRKGYYNALETCNRSLDINEFAHWFIDCCEQAQSQAEAQVEKARQKAVFWDKHHATELNPRQRKVLDRMLSYRSDNFPDGISANKYAAFTGYSKAQATRDLQDMVGKGVLLATGIGRATRYHPALPKLGVSD